MKKAPFLVFALLPVLCSGCAVNPVVNGFNTSLEDFSFSLSWGVKLDASYDSKTEVLVKTKTVVEHKPEDYVTSYRYPAMEGLYQKIRELDIYSYPNLYNPYEGVGIYTAPSTNYVLKVGDKTIEAKDCPLVNEIPEGVSTKGRRYLETVFSIIETIVNSEEWKALPDYEVFYL